MTTLSALTTLVSAYLRDTSNLTFTTTVVGELINAALVEIGRVAPIRFQEDLTPVADQLDYELRPFGTQQTLTTPFGVASTDTLTSTAHGLLSADPIRFLSLVGGTGLTVGTTYYVIASGLTTDAFKISATLAGSAVDVTTDISSGTFYKVTSDAAAPEIEIMRIEVWDVSQTPKKFVALLGSRYGEYVNSSAAGWEVVNGRVSLTNAHELSIDPTIHQLRIWGYAPWPKLTSANGITLSAEQEYALLDYVRVEAIKMLLGSRELFTQWQTASRNTDTSLAALAGLLDRVEASWRRRARSLAVLREAP